MTVRDRVLNDSAVENHTGWSYFVKGTPYQKKRVG
jgi:hypothetical protein